MQWNLADRGRTLLRRPINKQGRKYKRMWTAVRGDSVLMTSTGISEAICFKKRRYGIEEGIDWKPLNEVQNCQVNC
jgi:hypothetical protein